MQLCQFNSVKWYCRCCETGKQISPIFHINIFSTTVATVSRLWQATFLNNFLQTTTRPNSGNTRERRRSNLADIQVRTINIFILVLGLGLGLGLWLGLGHVESQNLFSVGRVAVKLEWNSSTSCGGGEQGDQDIKNSTYFHLEKKHTAWSCWSYLITSNPQPEGAPKEKNGVGLLAVMTMMAIRKP